MSNPITAIRNLISKGKESARKAAWEKDLRKQINRTNLMADMDLERQKFKDILYSERSALNNDNQTKLEAEAHKKRIDHAFCCLTILDCTQRNMKQVNDNNVLYGAAKSVAKSVRALEKCTGWSVDFGSDRLGTMLKAIRNDEEERSAEMEQLIPQILQSDDFSLLTGRIIKGETIEAVLKSEEALTIEGQAQAVMYQGAAIPDNAPNMKMDADEVQKRLNDYKKLK